MKLSAACRSSHTRWTVALLVALAVVLLLAPVASACPNCKDTLAANDPVQQGIVRGYFYSILFMMSMPFLILGSFGSYMYLEVRRARQQQQDPPARSDGE